MFCYIFDNKRGIKMIEKNLTEAEKIEIGRRCKELRENFNPLRKLSQREFAKKLNIPHSAVSNIESGNKEFTMKELFAYQKTCKVSFDYLLGLSEHQTYDMDIREISEKTGLSKKAIKNILIYKDTEPFEFIDNGLIKYINYFIESEQFKIILRKLRGLHHFSLEYSTLNEDIKYDDAFLNLEKSIMISQGEEFIDSSKYKLIKMLESLLDNIIAEEKIQERNIFFESTGLSAMNKLERLSKESQNDF